jgi:CubicO group peptidase (beta-lactamase class C family)
MDFIDSIKQIKKDKINTCLIFHKDSIVFEYYKNGKMREKLHKVNSVTKSILSILVGIAIDRKELEGVNLSISRFFPEISDSKARITIENLLTMSPGLFWPEFGEWGGRPFPMINSKDWVKFFLEREIVEPPGQHMYYNSGCSHLLSAILQKATGTSLIEYAKQYLFKPLGIEDFQWHTDSKGIAIGGFGLSLKAIDMLKIGKLMLQNGKYMNQVVVSDNWVKESTLPRYHTYNKIGSYGYHWWIMTDNSNQPINPHTYFAMGYGGQYIIVVPEYELVVTFTSELYNKTFRPLDFFKTAFIRDKLD